jgi:hypothetical protein
MTSSRRGDSELLGLNLRKAARSITLFLSKGKHRCIPSPLGFSLYNYHYYIVDCAFTLQEFIETLECILLFPFYP